MNNTEYLRLKEIIEQTFKGGAGSGNFGHEGRPGEVGGSASDIGWATGVIATRRLGGQVPQKSVNEAENILKKYGQAPSERTAPKTFDEIGKFYKDHIPVKGDTWKGKGIVIELSKIKSKPDGKTSLELFVTTNKNSFYKSVDVNKNWSSEIPDIEKITYR